MPKSLFIGTFLAFGAALVSATDKPPAPSVPAQIVVTIEARHGGNVPALNREDFMVSQAKEKLQVTDAVALTGKNADIELYVLIDDASNFTLGAQLADLRSFISAQPVSTAIGVGYMQHGTVQTAEAPTKDHTRAAKALRIPTDLPSSPYLSLSDLIKRWPESAARREVVMVTSGADPLGGNGVDNPYLDAAIADAQRAGILVCAIYTPATGHSGHSFWRMNWGQNYLSELAEDTGGEAYMLGFGAPVSIAPYLTEITQRLTHQYRVTLLAKSDGKAQLMPVKLTTEVPNAEIVAASKVYAPASK